MRVVPEAWNLFHDNDWRLQSRELPEQVKQQTAVCILKPRALSSYTPRLAWCRDAGDLRLRDGHALCPPRVLQARADEAWISVETLLEKLLLCINLSQTRIDLPGPFKAFLCCIQKPFHAAIITEGTQDTKPLTPAVETAAE